MWINTESNATILNSATCNLLRNIFTPIRWKYLYVHCTVLHKAGIALWAGWGWHRNIVEVGQVLHIPLLRREGLHSVTVRKRMVIYHCSIFAVRKMRETSILYSVPQ